VSAIGFSPRSANELEQLREAYGRLTTSLEISPP
jgi:hypothetical protein